MWPGTFQTAARFSSGCESRSPPDDDERPSEEDEPEPPPRLPAQARVEPAGVTVAGRPLLGADQLGPARAEDVVVQAVPADEGFWVGSGGGRRVWVQLVGGGESAAAVRVGDRVSFEGRAVPVPAGFAARAGVTPAEGAAELMRSGVLVEVPGERLVVR